jgi:hypothetical protein
MNQLLLGAAIPFGFALLIYAMKRARASLPWLLVTPVAMAAGAVWAIVPDLPRMVGAHQLYLKWSMDPRMNIFFWHYAIDATESDSPWYAAGLVVLGAAVLGIAWRELRLRERGGL